MSFPRTVVLELADELQGRYTGDTAMLDVYVSSGGVFDSADRPG